jgi:hypothetical protein
VGADQGSKNIVRWTRLAGGYNTKQAYVKSGGGTPPATWLVYDLKEDTFQSGGWGEDSEGRYDAAGLVEAFGIDMGELKVDQECDDYLDMLGTLPGHERDTEGNLLADLRRAEAALLKGIALEGDDAGGDYLLEWMADEGMVLSERNEEGWYAIECPWHDEHTNGEVNGRDTKYIRAGEGQLTEDGTPYPVPVFHCFHDSCSDRGYGDLKILARERGYSEAAREFAEADAELGDDARAFVRSQTEKMKVKDLARRVEAVRQGKQGNDLNGVPHGITVDDVVCRVNDKYAVVLMGGSLRVLSEDFSEMGYRTHQFLNLQAFRALMESSPKVKVKNSDGKEKWIPLYDHWMGSAARREYVGVTCNPAHPPRQSLIFANSSEGKRGRGRGTGNGNGNGMRSRGSMANDSTLADGIKPAVAKNGSPQRGFFNAWAGLHVDPLDLKHDLGFNDKQIDALLPEERLAEYAKHCNLYLDHLRTVICGGNTEHYEFLLSWMSDLVKRPWNKSGCAVVMKGHKGCGKGTVVEPFKYIFGSHYLYIDSKDHLVGRFNALQGGKVLLFADESFWGGDKWSNSGAEGKLKSLITEKMSLIEYKGIDAIQVPNYVHLFMASNEDWVVPATEDERRFLVLSASPEKLTKGYFDALNKQLNSGGVMALLAYLNEWDRPEWVDFYRPPVTEALQGQIEMSGDILQKWWLDCLDERTMTIPSRYGVVDDCYSLDDSKPRNRPSMDEVITSITKYATSRGSRTPGLLKGKVRKFLLAQGAREVSSRKTKAEQEALLEEQKAAQADPDRGEISVTIWVQRWDFSECKGRVK